MTYCPFQRPEPRLVALGGMLLDLLAYSQHEGFLYQCTRLPSTGSAAWSAWAQPAFSNLIYLQTGEVSLQIPDQGVEQVSAGNWVFVSALDQPLQIRIEPMTQLHWIECGRSIWAALQQDALQLPADHSRHACISCAKRNEALVFTGRQSQKMRLQIAELDRLTGQSAVERLRVASLSYELLSTTLDTSEFGVKPAADPCFRSCDTHSLDAAARYLEEHLDSDHSIRDLSRQFHLNEFKLKKGFKARFQTTVFGYLRKKRMEYAKNLLLQSEASVLEIATHVGYSNPSHFARAFRETFGVNPGALRRSE